MPKARKKPVAITKRLNVGFKRSSAETARLIRRFHVLNKELAKCQTPETAQRADEIRAEMEAMGGIDWYQKASQLGQSKTRGGDSSKWLVAKLEHHDLKPKQSIWQLLEVGAVAPDNYKRQSSWISVTPIDLNPQHASIQKQDFLKMKPPSTKFNIVSLSLVVNFVGDPKDRGQMLLHSRDFLAMDSPCRLLFLVLPLPCVTNSRYMSHEHLLDMMNSIGYTRCIEHHFSKKLAYYLFELTSHVTRYPEWKKKILPGKDGGARNNFSIVIRSPSM